MIQPYAYNVQKSSKLIWFISSIKNTQQLALGVFSLLFPFCSLTKMNFYQNQVCFSCCLAIVYIIMLH